MGNKTWLTPFAEIWEAKTDGYFPFGPAAKWLRRLINDHGLDEVKLAFRRYVNANDAQFLSIPRFAQTYGVWAKPKKEYIYGLPI